METNMNKQTDKYRQLVLETRLSVSNSHIIQLRRTRDNKVLGEMAGGFAHAHDDRFVASDIHSAISYKLVTRININARLIANAQMLLAEHNLGYPGGTDILTVYYTDKEPQYE